MVAIKHKCLLVKNNKGKQVNAAGLAKTNYYVRDASGNTMAVYEKIEEAGSTAETNLTEMYLYGSDRLGVYNKTVRIDAAAAGTPLLPNEVRLMATTTKNLYDGASYLATTGVTITLGPGFSYTSSSTGSGFSVRVGESGGSIMPADGLYSRGLNARQYELKDHLGNVRTVVNDQKLSVVTAGTPGSYEGKVISLANYYPFGMDQPGRTWSAEGKYRYGFNGKEKDSNGEWGSTNYDYGFRIYNPGVGRFLSTDPLTKSYPMLTPYQFAGNKPIEFIDLDGLEPAKPEYQWNTSSIKSYGYGTRMKVEGWWVFRQNDDLGNTVHHYFDKGKWKTFEPVQPEKIAPTLGKGLYIVYAMGAGITMSWAVELVGPYAIEQITVKGVQKFGENIAQDVFNQFASNMVNNGFNFEESLSQIDIGNSIISASSSAFKSDTKSIDRMRKVITELMKTVIDVSPNGNAVNGPGATQGEKITFYTEFFTRTAMSLLKEKEGKNLNNFNKQLNDILSKIFRTMIQKVVDETIGDGNPSSNEGNIKPKKK